MKIEEIYDLELKYQEVYDRTKDYTRNDFVIELIKKEDEKQELIEYLKEKISILDNILENEKDEDKIYNCLIRRTTFKEVLNKIEKE